MGKEVAGANEKVDSGSALACWDRKCTQFIINRVTTFLPKSVVGNKFEKAFNTEHNWYVQH